MRTVRKITRGSGTSPVKRQLARELRARMTDEERILWHQLRSNRLDRLHFRRQQAIAGFVVDFYCNPAGLAVEIDGVQHRAQARYDRERDAALARRGVRVLRFTNQQVRYELSGILATIAVACSIPASTSGEGG